MSGQFQLLQVFTAYFEQAFNVEIRGVTFADSSFSGLLLANGGDITFRDCAIRNHVGISPILTYHLPPGLVDRRRRKLTEEMQGMSIMERVGRSMHEYQMLFEGKDSMFKVTDEEDFDEEDFEGHRKLDEIDWQRQSLTLDGVEFAANKQGKRGGDEKFGMITIEQRFDDLEIKNCYFHDNVYGDPLDQRGYAVYLTGGSTLIMNDNCFVNNNLVGEGVVIAESETSLISYERNVVTQDDGLECQFIAVKPPRGQISCLDTQTTQCSIPGVVAPLTAPVAGPTIGGGGPVSAPTVPTPSGAFSSSRWSVALLALSGVASWASLC